MFIKNFIEIGDLRIELFTESCFLPIISSIREHFDFDNQIKNVTIDFSLKCIVDKNKFLYYFNLSKSYDIKKTNGFIDRPLYWFETDEELINIEESKDVAFVKNKSNNEIILIFSELNKNNEAVLIYTIREIIYRLNENKGRIPLHSSSIGCQQNGVLIIGKEHTGKTSLMLACLKAKNTNFSSNDICFFDKKTNTFFAFPLAILLSEETAQSLFDENCKEYLNKINTITYFKSSINKKITKFLISATQIKDFLGCGSIYGAKFNTFIVPAFDANKTGIEINSIEKEELSDIFLSQILYNKDDRYRYDYLAIRNDIGQNLTLNKNELFDCVKNVSAYKVTYGKDIYKTYNVLKLNELVSRKTNKGYCLHCHTDASDGRKNIKEILELALENNVETLAITDHNTMKAFFEARILIDINKEKFKTIQLIPAVEIDAEDATLMHILGYGLKDIKKFNDFLMHYENINFENYKELIQSLSQNGVDITVEKVLNSCKCKSLEKRTIKDYLIKTGQALSSKDANERYLNKSSNYYKERVRPCYAEILKVIKDCGGISILAHPYELLKYNSDFKENEEKLFEMIKLMKVFGLDGIESYSAKHSQKQIKTLNIFAKENSLITTGGTDFHQEIESALAIYYDKEIYLNPLLEKIKQ